MCNLSEGIYADGHKNGFTVGTEYGGIEKLRKIVLKKLAKGQNVEFIADDLDEDILVIQKIVREASRSKTRTAY